MSAPPSLDDDSPLRRDAVAAMLTARSIAIVGASARPDSLGARMIQEAQRGSASVSLINPRHDNIGGVPCLPSLLELDDAPDLVLLGVPDRVLGEQVRLSAQVGARSAVILGSAHLPGLRDDIASTAATASMAVCGAGCMGFINNVAGVRALGYLEPHPLPAGGVSLITHSGSAFSTLLRSRRGFGFRLAVSAGQELVTDTADYLDYALADPGTTVIALLLETPRSIPRLRRVLQRAAHQDVPVVILTVGGSDRGREMVAAHSGAVAGGNAGWAAFCASTGAIRVTDLAEFCDTIELLACGRRPPRRSEMSGARGHFGIATVHDSGAERALTVDIADGLGVEFAALSVDTTDRIAAVLDVGLSATNPLDVWGTGADTQGLFSTCLRAMTGDPAVTATALAVDLVTEYDGDTAYVEALIDVASTTDAPLAVLASVPSAVDDASAGRLRNNGVPVLEGLRSGIAALGHLSSWSMSAPPPAWTPTVDERRRQRWQDGISAGHTPGFELLADYGIPVSKSAAAATMPDVLAAAARIGYPVVLKTAGTQHKSDVGGVVLGLTDVAELAAAYDDVARRLGPEVVVAAMSPPGVEISVGFVRDDAFGPLVVVAAGGTQVELMQDRVVACPPVSKAHAAKMLTSLKMAPLLTGWRGSAPVALDALVDVIAGFVQMAIELGDVFDAVEANPVIATRDGVVAVDVLAIPRAGNPDQKML